MGPGPQTLIERYDRPDTLFYLDPPYWESEDDYGKTIFSRAEFAEMADVLSRIRGRFRLSLNAAQGVFETFSRFPIEEVNCTYSIAGGAWQSCERGDYIQRYENRSVGNGLHAL
jgi:DNA adenine methylase